MYRRFCSLQGLARERCSVFCMSKRNSIALSLCSPGACSLAVRNLSPAALQPATLQLAACNLAACSLATCSLAALQPAALQPATCNPARLSLTPATLQPCNLQPCSLQLATCGRVGGIGRRPESNVGHPAGGPPQELQTGDQRELTISSIPDSPTEPQI